MCFIFKRRSISQDARQPRLSWTSSTYPIATLSLSGTCARTETFGFQIIPLQLFTFRYHLLNIQHIYKGESGRRRSTPQDVKFSTGRHLDSNGYNITEDPRSRFEYHDPAVFRHRSRALNLQISRTAFQADRYCWARRPESPHLRRDVPGRIGQQSERCPIRSWHTRAIVRQILPRRLRKAQSVLSRFSRLVCRTRSYGGCLLHCYP